MMDINAKVIYQVKKQKGNNECLLWEFIKKYLSKSENDERVPNVFAVAMYGMVIFPKVPNHIEIAVVDLIDQVNTQANLVSTIIVETIRSLSYYHRKGKGQFIRCVQLLYIWLISHFYGECLKPFKYYIGAFVPIDEFCKKEWLKHQTREQWVATFRNLDLDSITWKALWMHRRSILYGCGDKLWVSLLGLWGVVSYATLLVLRQFESE